MEFNWLRLLDYLLIAVRNVKDGSSTGPAVDEIDGPVLETCNLTYSYAAQPNLCFYLGGPCLKLQV